MRNPKTIMLIACTLAIGMTGAAHGPAYDVGPPGTDKYAKNEVQLKVVDLPVVNLEIKAVEVSTELVNTTINAPVEAETLDNVILPAHVVAEPVLPKGIRPCNSATNKKVKAQKKKSTGNKFIDRHRRL